MDVLIIVVLFIVSLLLFAVEVFLVPGVGLAGIGAACGIVTANVLAFSWYGTNVGIAVMLGSIVCCAFFLYWTAHSKTIEKYALHKSIDSTAATKEQLSVSIGDEGVAINRLALIGNAKIKGKIVEVKSVNGFIAEGTPIRVVGVEQASVLVDEI